MNQDFEVYGVSAFGLKDCISDINSNAPHAKMYLADAVLPSTHSGAIQTNTQAEEERIHSGLPWPIDAQVQRGQFLRRVPISILWHALLRSGDTLARWQSGTGISFGFPEIIAAHIAGLMSEKLSDFGKETPASIVVAIPNDLDEHGQDHLIRALTRRGFDGQHIRLLWRPIAAALSWIEALNDDLPLGSIGGDDHIHVIYMGPDALEFVTLRLRLKEYGDSIYLLPVRNRPKDLLPPSGFDWACNVIENTFGKLDDGAFWQAFTGFPEIWEAIAGLQLRCEDLPRIWSTGHDWCLWDPTEKTFANPENVLVTPSDALRAIIHKSYPLGTNIEKNPKKSWSDWLSEQTRKLASRYPDGRLMGMILCGPLAPSMIPDWMVPCLDMFGKQGLIDPEPLHIPHLRGLWICGNQNDPIAKGAAIYGRRIRDQQPTYLDTLPSYGIWCEIKELGYEPYWGFYPLIPENTEIEGGSEFNLTPPVDRLFIKKGSKEFPISIKEGISESYKQTKVTLPLPLGEPCKVLVDTKMRPASGFAVVTVRSMDERPIFRTGKAIQLNWDEMDETPPPEPTPADKSYGYPFIAPLKGRISSEPDEIEKLRSFISKVSSKGILSQQQVQFLNNPGSCFLIPWGYDRMVPGSYSVGMFGPIMIDDEVVLGLADQLGDILYRTYQNSFNLGTKKILCKLLGFMYSYAPDAFASELTGAFASGQIKYTNQVIAAGRVFQEAEQFSCFVDAFIVSKYPDQNIEWYFWSFMRALCYYPNPARLSSAKGYSVFRHLYTFLHENLGNKSNTTLKKYCLCAVLFGLRLRELNPDFLGDADPLRKNLSVTIKKLKPQIGFPRTMFAGTGLRPIPGDNLNQFVIRFLDFQDTKVDRDLAGGLAAGG